MKALRFTVLIFAVISLTACSNYWREADPGISSEELFQMLADFSNSSVQTFGSANVNDFNTYVQSPYSDIYFADGPGPMGPAHSVMAIGYNEFKIFDSSLAGMSPYDLEYARVFFVDGVDQDQIERRLFLGVEFQPKNGSVRKMILEASSYEFLEDRVEITMEANNGQILLRSYDIEGQDLFRGVIQLRIYRLENGQEIEIGKFSTLVGFSSL